MKSKYKGMIYDTMDIQQFRIAHSTVNDIRNAEQMRDLLFNRKIELLHNLRDNGTLW